ncbi:MAG: hypothetical protein WBW88_01935 [Rhodothermales bacterium]
MDPGLHVKQGLNHLNRVLSYANFVAENGKATVHLTFEDWHVLADMLFHMDTPRELLPARIRNFALVEGKDAMLLSTDGCEITVEIM